MVGRRPAAPQGEHGAALLQADFRVEDHGDASGRDEAAYGAFAAFAGHG